MPYKNKEYQKEYHKKYWIKNQDRLKEQKKQYRKDNKEKLKESWGKYYLKNQDKILEKQNMRRKSNPEYIKIYKQKHKKEIKEKERKCREEKRLYIDKYKLSKGCIICGYNKCAAALDFHHMKDKKFYLASSIGCRKNINEIKREMDKCIVLCANCHRELHYKEENKLEEVKQ